MVRVAYICVAVTHRFVRQYLVSLDMPTFIELVNEEVAHEDSPRAPSHGLLRTLARCAESFQTDPTTDAGAAEGQAAATPGGGEDLPSGILALEVRSAGLSWRYNRWKGAGDGAGDRAVLDVHRWCSNKSTWHSPLRSDQTLKCATACLSDGVHSNSA